MKLPFKKTLNRINSLETVEQKSFWVIAPIIAILGFAGLGTAGFYESATPTIVSAILCLFIPVFLMLYVYKVKNYHVAYPMLCIFVGALAVPLTFVSSGGFLSGMPLFCCVATSMSAFCYSTKWRWLSFVANLIGNGVAFFYVYVFGTPYPLIGETTIYNDILFGYFFASFGLFLSVNMIISEIRKSKVSQDALQQYFDIEVRKEILKKALDGDLSLSSGNKKGVIMFADISNFTTITEKMPSDLISQFLNEFFLMAGKKIHETGGIIDKYIGDCIMAYWFEQSDDNCVYNAVKAALNMKKELVSNAEMIYKKYGVELNFSAGLAYGNVIFGDIGSENMHDYTIIGDAVNTASRIQNYAVGGEMLLSDSAAKMVQNMVALEPVETDIYFKGKNRAVDLYRIVESKEIYPSSTTVISNKTYGYDLLVCGCRGSFPVSGIRFSEYGGETSCYIIRKDDYAAIIDCGTGLKNAIEFLDGCKKIDILLTHVHYDHILGLLMAKLPENAQTRVFGYFDGWEANSQILVNYMQHPYWPVEIRKTENISVELKTPIQLDKDLSAKFYRSDHPDEACIIQMMCKDKKICFFSDCEDPNKMEDEIAKDADLVFFDGMFDDNDPVKHAGWGHSTWQEGVRYTTKLNIKKMIITHHNPEVADHTLHLRENEAREISKNVSFAKTGDHIII